MKPNHLFTSMLALATVVATSCSAPRLAQQSNNDDDVYNSVAQAKVYTPAPIPVQQTQTNASDQYNEDDYYGTSDPYYDMDYSSRINRFHYASPWRTYYDPYFDNWSMGFGSFYGGGWNNPYGGWGYLNSPFLGFNNWGWNNWGFNNWGWNNFYGGGYYGGGYYGGGFPGGGFLGGGGYYTGRTTNVPQSARPARGSRDGYTPGRSSANVGSDAYLSPRSAASRAARQNTGSTADGRTGTVSRPSRNTQQSNAPSRAETARPARESYNPPTYSPPPTRSSSGSSGNSGGGGSTGPSRPSRGGR